MDFRSVQAPRRIGTGVLAIFGVAGLASAAPDASLAAGRPLAPLEVRWKPERQVSPLPPWAVAPIEVHEGAAIFPLPARWQQPGVDRFVLTVVFEDTEDAGPAVEWRSPTGVVTKLSEGLGESSAALGLHARTLVLPDAMTREGGSVVVAMPWRIVGLVSVSVRPARDVTVAVTGASAQPGLVERTGLAVESEQLEGREVQPATGDFREGPIVEAELAADVEELAREVEFRVPVEGVLDGAVLRCEVLGLDPEARIDVLVNGQSAGELSPAFFRLDDPNVSVGASGRVTIAGWRHHSLYLPARLWKTGENVIVLKLRASVGPALSSLYPVSLKNTFLHLRFGVAESPPETPEVPPPWPVDLGDSGDPDFMTPLPIVAELPPLPLVTTAPPPSPPQDETLPLVTVGPRVSTSPPGRNAR